MKRPRLFGHPAIIALLVGLLIADYISIPGGYMRSGSTVKRTVEHATGRWTSVMVRFVHFPGFFMEDGEDIELVWETTTPIPGHATYTDLAQPGGQVDASWEYLGSPSFREGEPSGFYHITHRYSSYALDPHLTPDQISRMKALFVERSESIPPTHELAYWSADFADMRRLYTQGKTSERIPIPVGYYRNAVALALLGLLCISSVCGRTDLWLRVWIGQLLNRRPPGHCPTCGYDTRGLGTCPECGSEQATS